MGMRRGRSAHTVEAMPADCGVAIEWRRGRAAGQGSAPSDGGVVDANGRSAAPSAAPTRSPSADPGASQVQVHSLIYIIFKILYFIIFYLGVRVSIFRI